MPLFTQIVNAILPVIMSMLEVLTPILDVVLTLLKPIFDLISVLLEPLFMIIETVLPALTNVLKVVATTISKVLKPIFEWLSTFLVGVLIGAINKVKTVLSSVFEYIPTVLKSVLNFMIGILNSAIDGINLLLTPLRAIIVAVGKMFGASWDLGNVGIPHIPKLEQGGVLKKGQVGFLEGNGDEAVVPLSKNTGWIDKVAERINGSIGNNDQVVQKLDELINAITSMKIFLDTGVMVGEMTPAFDTALGNIYASKGRGMA